jgi:hypothetical protein
MCRSIEEAGLTGWAEEARLVSLDTYVRTDESKPTYHIGYYSLQATTIAVRHKTTLKKR